MKSITAEVSVIHTNKIGSIPGAAFLSTSEYRDIIIPINIAEKIPPFNNFDLPLALKKLEILIDPVINIPIIINAQPKSAPVDILSPSMKIPYKGNRNTDRPLAEGYTTESSYFEYALPKYIK